MNRISRLTGALALGTCITWGSAFAAVPGFHGTPNNYDVGMNPEYECQHLQPRQCSQWLKTTFRAYDNGHVDIPVKIENDTMNAFCGRVRFTVRDANRRELAEFTSPRYCIQGKSPGGAISQTYRWSFDTSPLVGQNGADLLGEPVDYEDMGYTWPWGIDQIAKVVADALPVVLQAAAML